MDAIFYHFCVELIETIVKSSRKKEDRKLFTSWFKRVFRPVCDRIETLWTAYANVMCLKAPIPAMLRLHEICV